jgi:GAF domain-containing protein
LPESPALTRFAQTVQAPGWTSLFPALALLCAEVAGHRLFTCSVFRLSGPETGLSARVYSSDQASYPVSGLKPVTPNRWTGIVIGEGRPFVANTVAGFVDVFPDHAFIAALGLGSVVNLPLIRGGQFLGTVNLLHQAGYFTPARLAALGQVTLPALLAFALSAETGGGGPGEDAG